MAGLHPILTRFDRLRTGRPGPAAGAFYRSTARIGARLLVAEDGEALLEGQLEPVAARDAVARPVVEVLVRNHPLHPLEVGVRGCAPRAPATPVRPGRAAPKAGELSLEPRKPCKYKQCRMLAMPVHRQTKTKSTLSLSPSPIMHGDTSCAARIARRPSLSGSRRPRPLGAPARPRTVGVPVSVCVATRHARLPISPQSCMDGEGCVCVRVRLCAVRGCAAAFVCFNTCGTLAIEICNMCPKTGFFDRTDGLGYGFRPKLLGSVASIINWRANVTSLRSHFFTSKKAFMKKQREFTENVSEPRI